MEKRLEVLEELSKREERSDLAKRTGAKARFQSHLRKQEKQRLADEKEKQKRFTEEREEQLRLAEEREEQRLAEEREEKMRKWIPSPQEVWYVDRAVGLG